MEEINTWNQKPQREVRCDSVGAEDNVWAKLEARKRIWILIWNFSKESEPETKIGGRKKINSRSDERDTKWLYPLLHIGHIHSYPGH